jgi:serine/threonine-protein kinase
MTIAPGQLVLGRYRFAQRLGEGAMGDVWEAENELIHRRVAIKVLHPHVAERLDAVKRFEREATAAGRIGSPHIVEVLDLGVMDDGARFIVMELLEGMTLAQRIRAEGRMSPVDAAAIGCQILQGIAAAHAVDIVHRDLKPANIFLAEGRGRPDFVKILDFGVSKFSAAEQNGARPEEARFAPIGADDMGLTALGSVVGTPQYMSPEQAKGTGPVDARSDLYAVGVILYECITGQVPFEAKTLNELIFRIVLEAPPPIETLVPEVDPAFVAIVKKAMAREPSERYASAEEMHAALSRWLSPTGLSTDSTGAQLFAGRATRRAKATSGERVLLVGFLVALAIGAIALFAVRPWTPDVGATARPAASTAATVQTSEAAATATQAPASAPVVTATASTITPPSARLQKPSAPRPKAPAEPVTPAKRTVPSEL